MTLCYFLRVCNSYPFSTTEGIFVVKAGEESFLQVRDKTLTEEELTENPYIEDEITPVRSSVRNPSEVRRCVRCKTNFTKTTNGEIACSYHPEKLVWADNSSRYPCCNSLPTDNGCIINKFHIYEDLTRGVNGPFYGFLSTRPTKRRERIFAMDCEMIFTDRGKELARVSIVDVFGRVKCDFFVRPEGIVLDLFTHKSGITNDNIEVGVPFFEAQKRVLNIIKSQDILIGHSLENDLLALKIVHRRVVDTSVLNFGDFSNRNYVNPFVCIPIQNQLFFNKRINHLHIYKKKSLKNLCRDHLHTEIQNSETDGHNSVEDARATLHLALRFAVDNIFCWLVSSIEKA